jgi:uncharacterized repeat protein (TIGR02543 family)
MRVGGWSLAAGVLAGLALLAGGAASSWAGATVCNDNWIGSAHGDWNNAANWDHGVPTSGSTVCISSGGPVLISGESAQAATLTLTGSQELDIEAVGSNSGTLTLSEDSTIDSGSKVVLQADCSSACSGNPVSALTMASGTLTNQGQIESLTGNNSDGVPLELNGNVTNTGAGVDADAFGNGINVQAPMEYGAQVVGATLDNDGTLAIANQMTLTVPYGTSSTVINDTGGSITNGGDGSGVLDMGAQTTFEQGGGTTAPHGTDPSNPVVVIDGSNLVSTLKYTGTGVSTVQAQNLVILNGSLVTGQNLVVEGINSSGCPESLVTSAASFTNAGTITMAGPCESGVKTTGGTLTNTGAIVAKAGAIRELRGSLTNRGTLSINSPTAFDGPGATLTQTAGTTTISPSQFLELTGSSGTFLLKGGLLQSPGSNASHQGSITGSLNNSGGNLAPGSTTAPGDLSLTGHYTQGVRGRLTVVIAGTKVGATYSQLGVSGGSSLGGTLVTVTHPGFHPLTSQFFTVLGGSTDTGKFARLVGQFPPGGVGYKPLYDKTDVTLKGTPAARLTVKRAGTKQGTVTSAPAGINCGTKCVASFFKPQTVTLTEHPVAGHKFKGWSGACTGTTVTCKVKMTKAKTVTATFS